MEGKELKFDFVHCNGCRQQTKHAILHEHRRGPDGDPLGDWWRDELVLLKCCGCEEVTLRSSLSDSLSETTKTTYYPPRVSRRVPAWLYQIKDLELVELFEEVYTALHAGSRRLALMGCRAILDRTMQAQVGSGGGFESMLSRLAELRLISLPDEQLLRATIEAGNAAAHRGYQPSVATLIAVVDIAEHVVQSPLLRENAQQFSSSTPPRSRKASSGTKSFGRRASSDAGGKDIDPKESAIEGA